MRPSPSNSFTLAAAAAWAAAELILGLTLGGFLTSARAEAVAFLTFRPFLLLFAAALAMRWSWRRRVSFYLLALLTAGLGEALLVLRLGSPDPWTEMLRALGASILVLVPADLILQAILRWLPSGRTGSMIAFLLGGLIALTPRAPWDQIFMAPGDGRPAEVKPRLLLMTSLPIVWGEYGAFDPRSRPSETYRVLQEEFEVQPIDTLDAESLGSDKLLLLAQPRWLSPSELVAFDGWVRGGGRAVILADPDLKWPTDLPIGDVRRPLPSSLLGPLLDHWRLELEPPRRDERVTFHPPRRNRKYVTDSPGRFMGKAGKGPVRGSILAYRTVGQGRAMLLADADLMRDDLWVASERDGAARHRRLADNPLYLADLLDEAAGISRPRVRAPVAWGARGGPPLMTGLQIAILPTLLLLALALALALRLRIRPHAYPQDYKG